MPQSNPPWTLFLVHHSHVDIGYTEPQRVIIRKHADFIAQALDYCTATDQLPPASRFCWTCEVSWTIKSFLKYYPQRADEFFRRVREGRIEVTALYLQATDLYTLELLEETTEYACGLAREHGFALVTAMNNDVNGWAWGLPDLLQRRGIRYMDTGINETRALGVRPRPYPYQWLGPAGGRVLLWHGDHYLHGNHVLTLGQPSADSNVTQYLTALEQSGYPTRSVEIRLHGRAHDNSPPGLWLSEMVQSWNQTHDHIRMVLCTPRQWFQHLEEHWPEPITVQPRAWCDWWADGNGSALGEVTAVRQALAQLKTLDALGRYTDKPIPAQRRESILDAAAFFCEHTWGAWDSTDDPTSLNSRAQWNTKAEFAYTAAVEAQSLLTDMLQEVAAQSASAPPGLTVFNPLTQERNDLVELLVRDTALGLPAQPWIQTPLREDPPSPLYLEDCATGQAIQVEQLPAVDSSARHPARRLRFVARDVPAQGVKRYRVIPQELPPRTTCTSSGLNITSPHHQITLAADGSGIASIRSLSTQQELVRSGLGYSLGELVYETIPGPFGREKLCGWGGVKQDCPWVRSAVRFGPPQIMLLPYGIRARLEAINLTGSLTKMELDVVVYDHLPRIDLKYELHKVPMAEAESLYCALPLGTRPQPEVWLDIPGGWMRPGQDQIVGTASDWHSLQHGLAVVTDAHCVAVASPDVPLVQVNGINTGLWQPVLPTHNGLVMSWVFNNYWFTNFPASQGGILRWRYSLQDFATIDRAVLRQFLSAVRQPLVGI